MAGIAWGAQQKGCGGWLGDQVSQSECEQVFFGAPLLVLPDLEHSAAETRYYCLGQTTAARKLFVALTIRGDLIRVISARPMSRGERRIYVHAEAQDQEKA
jgi:uncharacterized DUF497 family protein